MVDGERNTGPVGLVGLGNMGSAVAGRLAAQYPLIAYDVRPTDAIRELAAGGCVYLGGQPAGGGCRAPYRAVAARPGHIARRRHRAPRCAHARVGHRGDQHGDADGHRRHARVLRARLGEVAGCRDPLGGQAIRRGRRDRPDRRGYRRCGLGPRHPEHVRVNDHASRPGRIRDGGQGHQQCRGARDHGHAVRGGRDGGGVVNSQGQAWRTVRQSGGRPDQAPDAPVHGAGAGRRLRRRHADRGRA